MGKSVKVLREEIHKNANVIAGENVWSERGGFVDLLEMDYLHKNLMVRCLCRTDLMLLVEMLCECGIAGGALMAASRVVSIFQLGGLWVVLVRIVLVEVMVRGEVVGMDGAG